MAPRKPATRAVATRSASALRSGSLNAQTFKKSFDKIVENIETVIKGKNEVVRLAARRDPLRRPHPVRGRARHRQDRARPSHRPVDQRHDAARAVHARHAPRRHHRLVDPRPAQGHVRVPSRAGVLQRAPLRRDQPGHAEDAVVAARGHGRAPRVGRRRHLRPAPPVPRAGHPEPDRAGRHVPAARGPARPLPVQAVAGLHGPRRRVRGHVRQREAAVDRGPRPGHRHQRGPEDDRLRQRHRGLRRGRLLHRRPGAGQPQRPGHRHGRLAPRHDRPAAGVARAWPPATAASHVYPDDVRTVLPYVMAHRIVLNPDAMLRGEDVEQRARARDRAGQAARLGSSAR